jgi:hypothetical protein
MIWRITSERESARLAPPVSQVPNPLLELVMNRGLGQNASDG